MTKEAKILIGIALLVVVGGILLAIYGNPQPEQPGQVVDQTNLLRENTHMTGSKDAKVTVVEFGDYQCPACGAAAPIVKEVLNEYKDNSNVNFAFKNFPLDTIHPNAHIGSEAAEAAASQGKFWEMHDLLYSRQEQWSNLPDPTDVFVGYAGELGLNIDQFKTDISMRRFADVISADVSDGNSVGIDSTPTFIINGTLHKNVLSKDEMKSLIDVELAK